MRQTIKGKPPKVGYHVTYLDRWSRIKRQGLKKNVKSKYRSNPTEVDFVFLIDSYKKANWIARHISLDNSRDWVILRIADLRKSVLRADPDYCNDYENFMDWGTSLRVAGTFAYSEDISPSQISIHAMAKGTETEYHDEFSRFC